MSGKQLTVQAPEDGSETMKRGEGPPGIAFLASQVKPERASCGGHWSPEGKGAVGTGPEG